MRDPADLLTQREVVRFYEAAARRKEQEAHERLIAVDIAGWEFCLSWAERLRHEARREQTEYCGWSLG